MTGAVLNADNFLNDRPEVLAVRGAEGSGDVLPNEVSRSNKVSWRTSLFIGFSHLLSNAYLFHEQAGAFSRQAPARSGDRQILARAASAEDVHGRQLCSIELGNVPDMNHIWKSGFCDFDGKGFNLGRPQRHDAVADSRQWEAPDPVEETPQRHHQVIPTVIVMAGASAG